MIDIKISPKFQCDHRIKILSKIWCLVGLSYIGLVSNSLSYIFNRKALNRMLGVEPEVALL